MASLFIKTRLLLFALVWLSCAWFGSWALNPEQFDADVRGDRAGRAQRRADRRVPALTIDKAEFGGHVYLDKAPGMTLLALPATALAERISARPPIPPNRCGTQPSSNG